MDLRPLLGVAVLVVEDHPDTRELLTMVLGQAGALVTAVGTARDALASARILLPDVVTVDLSLTDGEDGYWLLERIRALPSPKPIIALAFTAHASDADRARALGAGFDAYVRKPSDPNELVERITRLVGS
ncbi:MAG: response regulator [Candidatus Rokubacteria bacterium]|nr:response regulator [Candidatus Rokubacteria bacterium]